MKLIGQDAVNASQLVLDILCNYLVHDFFQGPKEPYGLSDSSKVSIGFPHFNIYHY